MTTPSDLAPIQHILDTYCSAVRQTRQQPGHHPETSLYGHFEQVIDELAAVLGHDIQIIQQYTQGEAGSPDFGICLDGGMVSSIIEAKPPGQNLSQFTGQNRVQFERYLRLPNLIYTNYHELDLYQNGQLAARAELVPPQCLDPQLSQINMLLSAHNFQPAMDLIQQFLSFDLPPINSVTLLASSLARATWLVRDAVMQVMESQAEDSPLHEIYHEFRDLLFYQLENDEFADAYAQTLAYGLLIARQATQTELTMNNIAGFIDSHHHQLLSATLRLLSQPAVVQIVGWTLRNLIAVINSVSMDVLSSPDGVRDPLLYFYEDFLQAYDPKLRKERGVYYTPPTVVNLQTRVIDHLLVNNFGRRYGFADENVKILDPAVGTGTYLLSALSQGCQRIEQSMGADSIPNAASLMGKHLHGFEILIGPYTVARFRLASAIQECGGQLPERLPIVLTNTLLPAKEQPDIQALFGFMSDPLTAERLAADEIKNRLPIMVILGNPPYKRGEAEPGWMWDVLMESFREPVRSDYSGDFKNLAELSVWFYRWAIWKLFEVDTAPECGILSFISNSRWILGGAFGGMRQVFRQYFDRIYIIDLHGDFRAPLPAIVSIDENIFDNTGVGIAISFCIADGSRPDQEAEVFYHGVWGTQESKDSWLEQANSDLSNVSFEQVQGVGTDPFFPELGELFATWPALKDDIFVFSLSGVQTKRDHLVIAPTRTELQSQIQSFLELPDPQKPEIFHNASRTAEAVLNHAFDPSSMISYGYRPLDRHFLYNHPQFLDRQRPELQAVWGSENLALTTLGMSTSHGAGPVVFLHSHLPDICAFMGSYTSRVLPLWDNRHESCQQEPADRSFLERQHNMNSTVLARLSSIWEHEPAPEDVFAYCYAVLSAPCYSLDFSRELARSFPRVPLPSIWRAFQEGVTLGQQLVKLHSFQTGYPADGSLQIHGAAQQITFVEYDPFECRISFAHDTWVGPVTPEAWEYSVSGYSVLRQWLMRRREILFELSVRQELLDLIWVIERTVEMSGALDEFLSQLIQGKTLTRQELGLDDES